MSEVAFEPVEPKTLRNVIFASSLGTLIEWYDFYIFGALATVIASQFFPKGNDTVALLLTLATFATGFIVRPFGALIFGRIGDITGRKVAFLVTLLLMGLSTFAIGLLPTYEQVGILAPLLLVLLRLVQGLALGGEYGGAATYVAEHSPPGRRGYYTSFIQTTATLGLVVSLMMILGVKSQMSEAQFSDFGWRIPFLFSIVLIAVSYYIRRRMSESPMFAKIKSEGRASINPIKESFANAENRKWVLIALFGATAGQGVVWYTGQFHTLYFLQTNLKLQPNLAFMIVAGGLLLATPLFIVFGSLSDRIGRKKLMLAGCLLGAILWMPIFHAMTEAAGPLPIDPKGFAASPNVPILVGLVFINVVFVTMVYGPIAAFLVELFPTRIRYTSMSLPYHIGNGVFGGLVPFIAKSLEAKTGNLYAGLWYPIAIALITVVVGSIFIRERDLDSA